MDNNELRKRIARALGYEVIFSAQDGNRYLLTCANNPEFRASYYTLENDAWSAVDKGWYDSVETALALPKGPLARWLFNEQEAGRRWSAVITDTAMHGVYHFDAQDASLPVAICKAWLAYRAAQHRS